MDLNERARRHRALAKLVETKPTQFDMGSWLRTDTHDSFEDVEELLQHDQAESIEDFVKSHRKGQFPKSCGAGTACLGGWAILQWPEELEAGDSIMLAAAKVLGYDTNTYGESVDDDGLFSADAPWQTADEAARELRRRAAHFEADAKYGDG